MRSFPPEELYYITHIDNLQSILEKGILSHARSAQLKLEYTSIYNEEVVSIRRNKTTPDGKSLWHYANLYFQPRNPMMYSIVNTRDKENLVVISISNKVLHEYDVLVTDGNAANAPTQFYSRSDGLKILKHQWNTIRNDWWNEDVGSKRKIMAECLVPDSVELKAHQFAVRRKYCNRKPSKADCRRTPNLCSSRASHVLSTGGSNPDWRQHFSC